MPFILALAAWATFQSGQARFSIRGKGRSGTRLLQLHLPPGDRRHFAADGAADHPADPAGAAGFFQRSRSGSKPYMILFLLLETGMLGVFMALDLLLFFVFWEIGLVPMYFLIAQWGSSNRNYASLKFILYTMAGSLGLLLAIQMIGVVTGTFDLVKLFADLAGLEPGLRCSACRSTTVKADRLLGFCGGLCHQSAGLAFPHLAAGCPYRSAHRRFDDPGGCAAQAGRLRLPAPGAAALPGSRPTSLPAGWRCWARWRSSLAR